MTTCYVWIVATTTLAYEPLVAGLVKEGYQVGSLDPANDPCLAGELSCIISLRVSKGDIQGTPKMTVMNVIRQVMGAKQLTYHGIVVAGAETDATWSKSNIVVPKKIEEPQTALERITTQDLFEPKG